MTSTSATSHNWYLDSDEYYVSKAEAAEYPIRHGDLFPTDGIEHLEDWHACQLYHPTCELKKKNVKELQVIRVEPLDRIGDAKQQANVLAGFSEKDGAFRVEQASTFFLPPYNDGEKPMFSHFREIALAPREHFTSERRLAALTHEARVTLIRRNFYFRYRIMLTFDDVQELEATRISNDKTFEGPRPSWAPLVEDAANES